MVEPYSSNFRVITTTVLGVRIFRKFTVGSLRYGRSCLAEGLKFDICTTSLLKEISVDQSPISLLHRGYLLLFFFSV